MMLMGCTARLSRTGEVGLSMNGDVIETVKCFKYIFVLLVKTCNFMIT